MVDPKRVFEHLQSELFASLEACRARPRREAVHRLRTSARRMQALLKAVEQHRSEDAKLKDKLEKALRALKPVRKAAGPVRDMDVLRGLLKDLLKASEAAEPGLEDGVLSVEANMLDEGLKRKRRKAAAELVSVIRNSIRTNLLELSHLEDNIYGNKWNSLLKNARDLERQSVAGLDMANRASLHEYRKHSKFARYMAEMEEGPASQEFTIRLKKVLDAIGLWHDWMLLEEFARETLGRSSTLALVMKMERDRSLRLAVGSVKKFHQNL